MPDHPVSLHPSPPFNYKHPVYRAAADAAKAQSHGHCRRCGRGELPLEAHHWTRGTYPPAHLTTANDLTAYCHDCHDDAHEFRLVLDAGGSPEEYRTAGSETVATLLNRPEALRRSLMRVGRAVCCEHRWIALVTGKTPPLVGEVFRLFMRSRCESRDVVVTEVLGGRPGCWRVRKKFLDGGDDIRPMCVNAVCAEQLGAPNRHRQRPHRTTGTPASTTLCSRCEGGG